MTFKWPPDFKRIPAAEWTTSPIDELALQYDRVKNHGWYKNLDPTIEQLVRSLKKNDLLLDYSAGTGIFLERLLKRMPTHPFGVIIVDSSPKFLRLALEKFRTDERVAFQLIQYLKEKKRLQFVDEVIDFRFHFLVSTNAIHLYYDLQDTLQSWLHVLHSNATAFVQSGNIRNPEAKAGEWIIDDTVTAIHEASVKRVLEDKQFSPYREVLNNQQKMAAYEALRQKYFLPTRPLEYYVKALEKAGFGHLSASSKTIDVQVDEWYNFLSVYHEGILGWVGGTEKIEGRPPSPESIQDRLLLMQQATTQVFLGKPSFACCWTYITCTRP